MVHFYFQLLFVQTKPLFSSSTTTSTFPPSFSKKTLTSPLYMTAMDALATSSSFADDYSASRQADAIEAGSILISLANSHKPAAAGNKQELEAIPKHHRTYSSEDRHHSLATASHSNDQEVQTRRCSFFRFLFICLCTCLSLPLPATPCPYPLDAYCPTTSFPPYLYHDITFALFACISQIILTQLFLVSITGAPCPYIISCVSLGDFFLSWLHSPPSPPLSL